MLQDFPQLKNPQIILGLTIAVAIIFIVLAGHRIYSGFSSPSVEVGNDSMQGLQQPAANSSPAEKTDYGAAIANLNVFGKKKPPVVKKQEKIKVTRLKLSLKGILASNPERNAMALIGNGKSAEKAFSIGETLPGGAKLKEIYTNYVIIEHKGKLERLPLKRPEITIPD